MDGLLTEGIIAGFLEVSHAEVLKVEVKAKITLADVSECSVPK